MPSDPLENLVRANLLKVERPSALEIEGLIGSAEARLRDAENPGLAIESRFDLAYNAAHALALAALRRKGYRTEKRYIVFQALTHTLDLPAEQWRVLSVAHDRRNRVEYEGAVDVDEALLAAILRIARAMLDQMRGGLGPPS